MAKIITLAHQKGGVGKSTLTFNLAMSFQEHLNTCIVDTDPQGSLANLSDELDGVTIVQETLVSRIKNLNFEIIFIDTPPYLTNQLSELFAISDLVLVPTKAGIFDAMAIRATLHLIKECQIKNPNLKYGVVLNMLKHRSGLVPEALGLLNRFDAFILKTMIYDRAAYARSAVLGRLGNDDPKASTELNQLTEEIVTILAS
ncbi:MAG: ParA family protein [Thiothrix sp.]|nr:MAG: ParA family protein [Thiothrix sp.]